MDVHQEGGSPLIRLGQRHAVPEAREVPATGVVEGPLELLPLGQMRSPDKKSGDIGDIKLSILLEDGSKPIIEAWDAKYGKGSLTQEIEELAEKLKRHRHVKRTGFVVDADRGGHQLQFVEQLFD